jgi:hypothetical protein
VKSCLIEIQRQNTKIKTPINHSSVFLHNKLKPLKSRLSRLPRPVHFILALTLGAVLAWLVFAVLPASVRALSLSTQPVTDINATYATAHGSIDDLEGGTIVEHGHVWGTSTEPLFLRPAFSHWKMNDNAASTAVIDSMGNSNGTANQNTANMTAAGQINSALNFNGTSDKVTLPTGCLGEDSFTLAFWIKPNTPANSSRIFVQGLTGCSARQISAVWNSNKIEFYTTTSGTAGAAQIATAALTNNVWSHIVWTFDGTSHQAYVNGSTSTSSPSSTSWAIAGGNFIGCYNTSSNYHKSALDDLRFYKGALSNYEISILYSSGTGMEYSGNYYSQHSATSTTGSYTSLMMGLSPNTTHYVRSYAIDDANTITYGNTASFDTASTGYAVWTGATSTDWSDTDNWSTSLVPTSTVEVIIDGNYTNAPTLDLSGGTTTIEALSLGANSTSTLTLSYGNATSSLLEAVENVFVGNAGILTHPINTISQNHMINLNTEDIIIFGGAIDASGKGYRGGYSNGNTSQHGEGYGGLGYNYGGGEGYSSHDNYASGGGGYGGDGGRGINKDYLYYRFSGNTFGSIKEPLLPGGGGGGRAYSTSIYPGGNGGGIIKLNISGQFSNNGQIKANGSSIISGTSSYSSGGGAGGSIFISADTIHREGSISSIGGNGYYHNSSVWGGGGSGGRIAVYYTTISTSQTYQTHGGTGGGFGGSGTVYKKGLIRNIWF